MKTYKVIWFDDEFQTLEQINEQAFLHGIELIGFANAQEGIEELKKNIEHFDAAILDGHFHLEPNLSGYTIDSDAFGQVAKVLDNLTTRKVLPWFILSGQLNFTKVEHPYARLFGKREVYDKLNESHLISLWEAIKTQADQKIETQIRHKYSRVFEVCTQKYIGNQAADCVLQILKKEESGSDENRDLNLFFTPIRKIMEDLFLACRIFGLVPEGLTMNGTGKFLGGNPENNFQLTETILPPVIYNNVKNILSVCQPASHRGHIDSFLKEINSPYLIWSVTFQLFDVLLWFKQFIDANPDIEANKKRIQIIENSSDDLFIEGKIEKDELGNHYVHQTLITYTSMRDKGYLIGDEIIITKTSGNSQFKTKSLFPTIERESTKKIVQ